jgi:hypothetical protein
VLTSEAFSVTIAGWWDTLAVVAREGKGKFKWNREDETDPTILPEVGLT